VGHSKLICDCKAETEFHFLKPSRDKASFAKVICQECKSEWLARFTVSVSPLGETIKTNLRLHKPSHKLIELGKKMEQHRLATYPQKKPKIFLMPKSET